MILRKPYAFLIRHFKLIHLILTVLLAYILYKTNKLLSFFNQYLSSGKYEVIVSKLDGWTATTRDKSLSAQFEHTMAVTKDGVEIFTLSPKGYTCPPYNK